MQFLRTLFWVVLAIVVVYFAWANPQTAQVNLWAGLAWFPPMWFALVVTFLLGLVPMLIIHRTTRWSLRRRLDTTNRALSEIQATASPPPPFEQPRRLDTGSADASSPMPPPGVD